ncbi:hypothetical protein VVR12_00105 [Rothia sp. LK2588]
MVNSIINKIKSIINDPRMREKIQRYMNDPRVQQKMNDVMNKVKNRKTR